MGCGISSTQKTKPSISSTRTTTTSSNNQNVIDPKNKNQNVIILACNQHKKHAFFVCTADDCSNDYLLCQECEMKHNKEAPHELLQLDYVFSTKFQNDILAQIEYRKQNPFPEGYEEMNTQLSDAYKNSCISYEKWTAIFRNRTNEKTLKKDFKAKAI